MGKAEQVVVDQALSTGYLAMDRDYAYSRIYGCEEWVLFCTVAGAGRITHRLGELHTVPGELVLIQPRFPQDYGTHPGAGHWKFIYAHFLPRPTWAAWLRWPVEGPGVFRLRIDAPAAFAAISRRALAMDVMARSNRHHREDLAMNALEEVLLWCEEHNHASPAYRDGRMDPRIRRAVDRLCRDLAASWDVATLAQVCAMSPSRFAHLFRVEMGESPRRFIERQRIERGRHLLRTSALSVSEIATAVGYADPFHFSTRFRALTGKAPRAYRDGQGA